MQRVENEIDCAISFEATAKNRLHVSLSIREGFVVVTFNSIEKINALLEALQIERIRYIELNKDPRVDGNLATPAG
jgi:hypothetical protein